MAELPFDRLGSFAQIKSNNTFTWLVESKQEISRKHWYFPLQSKPEVFF